MYAVIETGGKQYKVAVGDEIFVEKLEAEAGATVELKALLIADGDVVKTGDEAAAVKVTATVDKLVKGKKIVVYRYKAKKNARTKQGHRQTYTKLTVTAIG